MQYYMFDGQDVLGPFEALELLKRPGFKAETLVRRVAAAADAPWETARSFPDFAAAYAMEELLQEDLLILSPRPASAIPPPRPAAPPPPPPPPRAAPPPTPRAIPPAPHRPAARPVLPPPGSPAQPVAAPPTPLPRPLPLVMIVDDEPDVCEIIKYHTQKAGFRTVIAHNGIDAAAKMNIETPSMIILDLMMPGQSGYEFLRSMNAAGYGRIPVSIITARRMDSSTDALLRQETNVVDLFPKPFDVPQFIASVRRHAQPAEAA